MTSVLSTPTTSRIAKFKQRVEEYGGQGLFRRSALNIRDGAGVFEQVLGSGLYRSALEIGTYRGITAAYMAQFCEQVITIDLEHGRKEHLGDSFDRYALWETLGIHNIELCLVKSNKDKAALIRVLDFDFAFIDGDHSQRGVTEDFEMVRRCGTVLMHDYDPSRPNGVTVLVGSLPKNQWQVIQMDIFAFCQSLTKT